MNYEEYGRSTASAQYFLQLAGYLGIPVIAWNADNSGLERVNDLRFSNRIKNLDGAIFSKSLKISRFQYVSTKNTERCRYECVVSVSSKGIFLAGDVLALDFRQKLKSA